MSDKTFLLEIITPEKVLISEDVESVEIPGAHGEFQVLTGHTPFLTGLSIGPITIMKGARKTFVSVSGGYCEVDQNKTTILAHTAEMAGQIDKPRAETSQKRAQKRLMEVSKDSSVDEERARLSLLRAINRLDVTKMK